MTYKKILRWQKSNLDTPLSVTLLSACILATKANPLDYIPKDTPKEKKDFFVESCKVENHFFGQKNAIQVEFFNQTKIELKDLISSEIWLEIFEFDSFTEFLETKTFTSKNEIKNFCSKIFNEFLQEKAFDEPKKIQQLYGKRGYMYHEQMKNICKGIDNKEKWVEGTANQLWFGTYALKCITDKFTNLMKVEQSDELYRKAVIGLKEAFRFSDLQVEMLKYFCCQSKEGNCPSSLNKALYFWSDKKGTGKTTVAATIVAILNGEPTHSDIRKFKSTLPQELGFMDHVAPMICSARAVLLDEAMPKDSSKSYGTLKDRITSDGAKIRFVYKNQIDVEAKANYVFTSNDPLLTFIQDKSDRRFLEFEISQKYKKLTYIEIHALFLQFVQQCQRTKEWQEWYDDMQSDTEVKGIESQTIDDLISYFKTAEFASKIQNHPCQISIGAFYQHVKIYEQNFNKQLVRECITKLFGEPVKPSTWRKMDIIKVLSEVEDGNELILTEQGGMPF